MSSPQYRPRRRLRSEIFPLAAVFSLALAIYFAFPSGSIEFTPSVKVPAAPGENCFISLDPDREAELLASARASWQSDAASRRGVRANLLSCDSFGRYARIASGLLPPASGRSDGLEEYEVDFVPSGVAAEAPALLTPDTEEGRVPVFSRDELLRIN